MKKVSIITSATYNIFDAKGAYGCIVITENKKFKLEGCYTNSTVNRLELMAVIHALEEIALLYPENELQIELCSKQTYLTSAFSPGKLKQNLLRGELLPNYDLWKRIFDLGKLHKWKPTQIKTMGLEDFHKKAAKHAAETTKNTMPINDQEKKKVKSIPVLDIHQESEQQKMLASASHVYNVEHPTIENNDPPF